MTIYKNYTSGDAHSNVGHYDMTVYCPVHGFMGYRWDTNGNYTEYCSITEYSCGYTNGQIISATIKY